MNDENDRFDSRLQQAIDLIYNAFKDQKQDQNNLIDKLKLDLQDSHKSRQELEQKNFQLQEKIKVLDKMVQAQKSENESIVASYNSLSIRYSNLKRMSSQLEAFRRNMIGIIQNSPAALESLDTSDDFSFQRPPSNHFMDRASKDSKDQFSKSAGYSRPDKHNSLLTGSRSLNELTASLPMLDLRISDGKQPSPIRTANMSLAFDDGALNDGSIMTNAFADESLFLSKNQFDYPLEKMNSIDTMIDGPDQKKHNLKKSDNVEPAELYRVIRERITSEDFESFAVAISDFNNGKLDAGQSLARIQKILNDDILSHHMALLIQDS